MKKVLRWFVSPLFLSLLGLVAVALLIWWLGPFVKLNDHAFLESESVRWILIGVLAAAWLLRQVVKGWSARRRNARLMDGISKPAPRAREQTAAEAEVVALNQRFEEAIGLLKQARSSKSGKRPRFGDLLALSGRQYLYQLPWYVFIGAPGSGKTTALVNSGLRFPLAERFGTASIKGVGGTRNCDWWFTDEAVLLDTAGRYATQDSDKETDATAWTGFLALLKKSRPRSPINGVLLTISALDLLQQSASDRERYADAIQKRIQELHAHFQTRFPIYLLVTKVDLLSGFTEFFGAFGKEEREQVWGMTFPVDDTDAIAGIPEMVREFDALEERLIARVPERMQSEHDPARRALIHAFPQQIGTLKGLLLEFIERVFTTSRFEQATMFRGVYFTSGTQEGHPIDRVMGLLARSLGVERKLMAPPAGGGRSYFLSGLLRDVVFKERGLAGTNLRWERRRNLLQWSAYAAALCLFGVVATIWLVSYLNNRSYVRDIAERVPAIEKELSALPVPTRGTDLAALLPTLDRVKALADSASVRNGVTGFGLSQYDRLASAADEAYQRLLRDALLPRVDNRVEERLRSADLNDTESLYDTLRTYRMLHDPKHFDADAVRKWVIRDWEGRRSREMTVEESEGLKSHLAEALAHNAISPLAEIEKTTKGAREIVAKQSLAQRVYARMKADDLATAVGIAPFDVGRTAGATSASFVFIRTTDPTLSRKIPAIYTLDGYRKAFRPNVQAYTERLLAEEPWVMGTSTNVGTGVLPGQRSSPAIAEVTRLYFADYVVLWRAVLNEIKVRNGRDLKDNIAITQILSTPQSPLKVLMKAIAAQTTFTSAEVRDKSMLDIARNAAANATDRILPSSLTAGANAVTDQERAAETQFADVHDLVTPLQPGAPAPIDTTLQTLEKINTYLNMLDTAVAAKLPAPPSEVPAQIKVEAPRYPEPIRSILTTLTNSAKQQANFAERSMYAAAVKADITPYCNQATEGRYPFSKKSRISIPLKDFTALFGPNGVIDGFFKKNLSDKVDMTRKTWEYKRVNDSSFGSSNDLIQFQRAKRIQDIFFRNGSTPSLKLDFRNYAMDQDIQRFTLNVDGQIVTYANGAVVTQTIVWPSPKGGSTVRMEVLPAGKNGSEVSDDDPWALFRLLDDRARIEATAQPEKVRAAFSIDARKAEFDITADSVLNPFKLTDLETFRCPSGV